MKAEQTPINVLTVAEQDALWFRDELAIAWRAAEDEAVSAYHAWREFPGAAAYAVYRAAQDRADQAQDELAHAVLARAHAQ